MQMWVGLKGHNLVRYGADAAKRKEDNSWMELSALFRFDLELSLYYRNKMTEKKSRNTLIFFWEAT